MKNVVLFLALLIAGINTLVAYPIPARPLNMLVEECEIIVYGVIVDIDTSQVDLGEGRLEGFRYHDVYKAVMLVQEVLKGSINTDTIYISFDPNMICPQPADYHKRRTTLAFLNKKDNYYSTHALSYGSKTISDGAYKIYKERITELFEINKVKNEKKHHELMTSWLVKCAQNSATRWEGTFLLSPTAFYTKVDDKKIVEYKYKYPLSPEQKFELRKSYLKEDKFNYDDFELLNLIKEGEEDPELFEFLIVLLKKADYYYYTQSELISQIASMSGITELKSMASEYSDLSFTESEAFNHEDFKTTFLKAIEN